MELLIRLKKSFLPPNKNSISFFQIPFQTLFIIIASSILAILISLRPPGIDRDYLEYFRYYENSINGIPIRAEKGLIGVSILCHWLGIGFKGLLCSFALFGILSKLIFANKYLPDNFWIFLIFYSIVYLPLWEMTQIRTGVTTGLISWALLTRGNKSGIFLILSSTLFHLSSIIFLPLFILERFGGKFKFIGLLILVSGIYFFQALLPYYKDYSVTRYPASFNYFSFQTGFVFLLCILGWFLDWRNNEEGNFLKISFYVFSLLLIVFTLNTMPAVQIRLFEQTLYFSIILLLILPSSIWINTLKWLSFIYFVFYFAKFNFFGRDPILSLKF